MADVETVTVEYTGSPGPVVINKSDYDPEKHTLVGDSAPKKKRGRPRKKSE